MTADDRIEHFRRTRRAWQALHGTKNGKRTRCVDIENDGTRRYAMVEAVRFTFSMENLKTKRRPSRRRTALWGVS